ncbi:MAG: hypothetical protein OEV85_03875 [Candidatus Thorarchaeota archaeon]|nr:hypothetical protein [Candidatus Thorarchaeota archaeon]
MSKIENQPLREKSFMQDFMKYFIHGALYSVLAVFGVFLLSLIGTLFLAMAVIAEVATGSNLVGWILVVVMLGSAFFLGMIIIGFINVQLSRRIWKVKPSTKIKSLFGHGGILALLMFVAGIPTLLFDYLYSNPDILVLVSIAIPRFIIYATIDGYLGRFIGIGFSDIPIASRIVPLQDSIITTRDRSQAMVLATPDLSKWQPYEKGLKQTLPRYLAHGTLYVLLMLLGSFIIGFFMIPVAFLSAQLTLAIGILAGDILALSLIMIPSSILFLFLLGAINTFLSKLIWKMDSSTYWKSVFVHGTMLFLMVYLFGIPGILLDVSYAAIISGLTIMMGVNGASIVWIILFIIRIGIYLIIYGFIGRFVAAGIKTIVQTEQIVQKPEEFVADCPFCNARTQLHMNSTHNNKIISCTKCRTVYDVIRSE